jgi:hypothetical protein
LNTDPDPELLLFFWITFALLDPNQDSESGSTALIESGSKTLISQLQQRVPYLTFLFEFSLRIRGYMLGEHVLSN